MGCSKREFLDWVEDNRTELAEKFAEHKDDDFMVFCLEDYNSTEADLADRLYDEKKDRQAELQAEKNENN